MLFQKCDRFLCHAIFNVFVGDVRVVIEVFEFPWCNITSRRAGTGMMWNVDIKTMLQGRIRFRPEVPFAEMAGCVTVGFQGFRQRVVFRIEP